MVTELVTLAFVLEHDLDASEVAAARQRASEAAAAQLLMYTAGERSVRSAMPFADSELVAPAADDSTPDDT